MKLLDLLISVLVLVCCAAAVNAAALTENQKSFIDRALVERGLNIYGDPEGTVYAGGCPLFDEANGQSVDRHEFVLKQHPDLLEGFVELLPVDGVERVVSESRRISNDFDARRVPGRVLATLRSNEEAIALLVESVASAVERRDLKAVADLFAKVSALTDAELKPFGTVFKQARRMLQMPTIMPIEVTAEIQQLLETLDRLEARLR